MRWQYRVYDKTWWGKYQQHMSKCAYIHIVLWNMYWRWNIKSLRITWKKVIDINKLKLILKRKEKEKSYQKPKICTHTANLDISTSYSCSKKKTKTTNSVASSNPTLLFHSVGFQTCEVGGQSYVPFGGTRRESVPYPFSDSRGWSIPSLLGLHQSNIYFGHHLFSNFEIYALVF